MGWWRPSRRAARLHRRIAFGSAPRSRDRPDSAGFPRKARPDIAVPAPGPAAACRRCAAPCVGVSPRCPRSPAPAVAGLLDRLFAAADQNDPAAFGRARDAMARLGQPPSNRERAELMRDIYMPVSPEVGRLLYLLARSRNAGDHRRVRHVLRNFRDSSRRRLAGRRARPAHHHRVRRHQGRAGAGEFPRRRARRSDRDPGRRCVRDARRPGSRAASICCCSTAGSRSTCRCSSSWSRGLRRAR